MNVFAAIFKRELKGYFATPIGYVFIVVFLIGSGYIAFAPGYGSFFEARQAHVRPLFDFIPYLFVFLIPAVSMRLWAEERRTGTVEILFTLPVKTSQAVLAKFLATWAIIGIALVLTGTLVAIACFLGKPDWGPILSSYLGAFLLGGVYLAIGCCCSALSKNQVISFILCVIACVLFLILGSPPILQLLSHILPAFGLDFIEAHSLQNHYESMQMGVLKLNDLVFFTVMIACWLIACSIMLEEQKAK